MERGKYGQLMFAPDHIRAAGLAILDQLVEREQIRGPYVDYDKHRRGSSLNYDLYGFDGDLFVYQARQAWCDYRDGWLNTRKTYALAGSNENGSPFWHPIGSHIVRRAITLDPDPAVVVRVAICWIFRVDLAVLPRIVRHGDVALVPARRRGDPLEQTTATLADSHVLTAAELRDDHGKLYARDAELRHSRGQHADVSLAGWSRVA